MQKMSKHTVAYGNDGKGNRTETHRWDKDDGTFKEEVWVDTRWGFFDAFADWGLKSRTEGTSKK